MSMIREDPCTVTRYRDISWHVSEAIILASKSHVVLTFRNNNSARFGAIIDCGVKRELRRCEKIVQT